MEDKIFYPHIITFRIINRKFLNEQCQFLGIFLFNRFCHSLVCRNLYIVIEAIEDTALSDTFYDIIRIDDDSTFAHLTLFASLDSREPAQSQTFFPLHAPFLLSCILFSGISSVLFILLHIQDNQMQFLLQGHPNRGRKVPLHSTLLVLGLHSLH